MLPRLATAAALATSTAVFALVGCQTDITIEDGTTSSTSVGVTTSVSASASTGAVSFCDGYDDSDGSTSVTVTVTNASPFPLYLPADCTGAPILDVTPASGPDGNTYAFDPSCLQTCADLQHEPAYECGVCAPASILIASGASRDFTWQGTALSAPRQMPAQCWDVPQQADSCVTLLAAAPQTYRFLVNGFANCGDGACACDSEGLCSGYATGQPGYATPSELLYPTEGKVEILFDACAFGCAEPQP
ncbi:MAG: hypothetical protein U0414_25800 [Polyangiaceae bacterium]